MHRLDIYKIIYKSRLNTRVQSYELFSADRGILANYTALLPWLQLYVLCLYRYKYFGTSIYFDIREYLINLK